MSDRRENSVLFSLKELRRIEDDRVRREQDDARTRAESARQAREAEERATREAEERRRLEEETRLRRIEDEKNAREREGSLRLQEAERRARVEGEVRLQEEKLRLDAQHRAKHSPVKAVLTVAGILVVIGGGLGYKMYSQHQTEIAVQKAQIAKVEAEKAKVEAEKARAEAEFRTQMARIQKDMDSRLASAKSDEERDRIRAEAAQRQAAIKAHHAPAKGEKETPAGAHDAQLQEARDQRQPARRVGALARGDVFERDRGGAVRRERRRSGSAAVAMIGRMPAGLRRVSLSRVMLLLVVAAMGVTSCTSRRAVIGRLL